MRALMVTGSYPPQPCGVGDYTARLVRELEAAGVHVDVLTTASERPRNEPRVALEVPDWRGGSLGRVLAQISPETYDIAHIQYPARFYGYLPGLAFLTSRLKHALAGKPIIVTLHEFSITHILRKLTIGAIATPASWITVTTESEKRPLLRWFPWLRKKVSVIHMAPSIPLGSVGPERRQEIRRALGVGPEENLVVYFGLLHPNKGIRKLIESLNANALKNSKLRLLVLSHFEPENTPFHAELRDLAMGGAGGSKVIWAGFLDDTASSECIAASDVACLPFEDGVTLRRLSFMAAMGLGRPTITTVGDVRPEDMGLVAGEHAFMLPTRCTPVELGEALATLLESPSLRERLSLGARAWSSRFQWGTVVQETLALYHDLEERA